MKPFEKHLNGRLRTLSILATVLLLFTACSNQVDERVQISFTFSGTGSGTVNAVPFADADYTITAIGYTSGVTSSPGNYSLSLTTVTIGIMGIGTATVTDSVWIFDNQQSSGLGIGRNGPGDLLDVNDAAFATYALATSLGPISGLNASALYQFTNLASTLGPITLSSSGPVTFEASLVE